MELTTLTLLTSFILFAVLYLSWIRNAMLKAQRCNCEKECKCGETGRLVLNRQS